MRNVKRRSKLETIDDYLAPLDRDKRAALERLRTIIHQAAPEVEECISYQLPAFRLDGRMLVFFGAGANHCAFYPGGIVQEFKDELADFETSKGTIRFQPERPLSATLIKRIIKARIAQNAARRNKARRRRADRRGTRPLTP